MAIFSLSVQVISRSSGRSSVAAAAYRAGERLRDSRTHEVHDYSKRSGVLYKELIGWSGSREELWCAAEHAERRVNACVAREARLALPAELSFKECVAIAKRFAEWLRRRYGVVVDLAIHAPSKAGDPRNIHAHLTWTTREVSPEGRFGDKTRILDQRANGPGEIRAIRYAWQEIANAALERAKVPQRIDARSLAEQGSVRIPMVHMGPKATAIERRGGRSWTGSYNRWVVAENTRRIAAQRSREAAERPAIVVPVESQPGRTVQELLARIAELARVTDIRLAAEQSTQAYSAALRVERDRAESFLRVLERAYLNPIDAREKFYTLASRYDVERAVLAVQERPQTLGRLRPDELGGLKKLLFHPGTMESGRIASEAAVIGKRCWEARVTVEESKAAMSVASQRLKAVPTHRQIGRAISKLSADDLAQLRAYLERPGAESCRQTFERARQAVSQTVGSHGRVL